MTLERLLRAIAVAIAVLGIVDPAITATREVPATVAVIETTAGAADALTLPARFRVHRGLSADAAATIVIGDRLPAFAESISAPAFFVQPEGGTRSAVIRNVVAPARARFESRIAVNVTVETHGAAGQTLVVRLDGAGTLVDRVERKIERDGTIDVPLTVVPAAIGLARIRASASLGSAGASVADFAVDVDDRPWAVLFFDRRPAWNATFVRRLLEQDPRFAVSSRVVAATGVVTRSGRAPETLVSLPDIERFDAIVVGAPDALTAVDVAGLEAFARRRGGAVVMLLDAVTTGPAGALIGVERWVERQGGDPVAVPVRICRIDRGPGLRNRDAQSSARGRARLSPRSRAKPGRPRRSFRPQSAPAASWSAGCWTAGGIAAFQTRRRYGDFFRSAIGSAADASPPAVDLQLSRTVIAPGEAADLRVTVREAVLADPPAPGTATVVSATVSGVAGSSQLRLWPEAGPGRFRATVRGPATPGTYSITVAAGTETATARLAVVADATDPAGSMPDLIAAWATSRGGQLLIDPTPETLAAALTAAVPPTRRPSRLHPLRSGWWIAAFAAALGGEWWLRRRREMK